MSNPEDDKTFPPLGDMDYDLIRSILNRVMDMAEVMAMLCVLRNGDMSVVVAESMATLKEKVGDRGLRPGEEEAMQLTCDIAGAVAFSGLVNSGLMDVKRKPRADKNDPIKFDISLN